MNYTSQVDNSSIRIDIEPGTTCGIMMSGGIDSSVLMALLIEEYQAKNQDPEKIIVFTIPKLSNTVERVNAVLEFLEAKYNVKLLRAITVGDLNAAHDYISTTAVIEAFSNYPLDFIFLGTTHNPPEGTVNQGMAPTRVKESPVSQVVLPFIKWTKQQTVDLLYQRDLHGLLEITYSCTEQAPIPCLACWQCGERAWALAAGNNQ